MSTPLDNLFEPYPVHLSVNNLATVLGVTLKTAYEYLQNNQIPCYRIGTRWMILRDEVKEFMQISARISVANFAMSEPALSELAESEPAESEPAA